jgi:NACHT domain
VLCNSERVDLLVVQQDDDFKSLDQIVQTFVKNLANGYSKLSDHVLQENSITRSTITQEHRDTRDHVTSSFRNMQISLFNEQDCAKLLESLYYPEIYKRSEEISEVHAQTFNWIFDRTGRDFRPWDNFSDWLEKGDGIYWVNGKAGSGKSTLMNYITTDSRMAKSLNKWSHPLPALAPKYFTWNAGTDLQKSSLGLLRSLLYQVLYDHQQVIPELIKSQGAMKFDKERRIWTKKRLESSLKFVVDQISLPFCFFIDGLDEFDEGEEDLLGLIAGLQNQPSVKICLSSRPLQSFINAFERSAQLKLQDLTRRDIEIYVADRLHKDLRMKQLLQDDSERGNRLIGTVIAKAEGVFLWVELAVKFLIKGLTNKDGWETMEKRVELLPKGMQRLYMHMWNRLGEDEKLYREEAALYFRIILVHETSILEFLVAMDENLQSILSDFTSTPPGMDDIISMCKAAKVRVLTRCAGLLEVDGLDKEIREESISDKDQADDEESYWAEPYTDEDNQGEADKDGASEDEAGVDERDQHPILAHLINKTRVRFLHRTARDFISDTKEGQIILGDNPAPAVGPHALLVKSELSLERLKNSSRGFTYLLNRIADAQIAENDPLESLLDFVESYISSKYSGISADSNWVEKAFVSRDKRYEFPATDFMGIAVAHGLRLDISKKFLQQPRHADPGFTSYLLSCAVCCYPMPRRWEVVLSLLLNGADPSRTFQFWRSDIQISCWNQSLIWLWIGQPGGWNDTISNVAMDLNELIEAFLDNGADLHGKFKFGFSALGHAPDRSWYWKYADYSNLFCELSVRYILTELLRDKPRFSRIEKRLESAGAHATRRVLFADDRAQNWVLDGALDLSQPISEQDSQYLLNAIDECESLRSKGAADSLKERTKEVRQRNAGTMQSCQYRGDSSSESDCANSSG